MISSVFEFIDYRVFLRSWVEAKGSHRRGEWSRIAKRLGVTSTMISQVMREERNLSPELANELCDYMGLGDDESNFFLLLVEHARAGSHNLRRRLKRRIEENQKSASTLKKRLKVAETMATEAKTTFYSDWLYSAVRNFAAVDKMHTVETLADRFQVSREKMRSILDFLIENELCSSQSGFFSVGPQKTHVGADSPLVISHHRNWRLRSMEQMRERRETDLFYTGPMSLSNELAVEVRCRIPTLLEQLYRDIGPSKSETVRCLNIDWFEF